MSRTVVATIIGIYTDNYITDTSAVAARNAIFGMGVGSSQISNVACVGNETGLLNCSHQTDQILTCGHFTDAGVECLGRPLRE